MKTTIKPYGERLLVEPIYRKDVLNKEEFTGRVKVISVSDVMLKEGFSEGDVLAVTGIQTVRDEHYVMRSQVMGWVV